MDGAGSVLCSGGIISVEKISPASDYKVDLQQLGYASHTVISDIQLCLSQALKHAQELPGERTYRLRSQRLRAGDVV